MKLLTELKSRLIELKTLLRILWMQKFKETKNIAVWKSHLFWLSQWHTIFDLFAFVSHNTIWFSLEKRLQSLKKERLMSTILQFETVFGEYKINACNIISVIFFKLDPLENDHIFMVDSDFDIFHQCWGMYLKKKQRRRWWYNFLKRFWNFVFVSALAFEKSLFFAEY